MQSKSGFDSVEKDLTPNTILDIVENFGTPLFVYDRSQIDRHYKNIVAAYHKEADIFYSVKANPCPGVIKVLKDLGSGAEVASTSELTAALNVGVDPSNILAVGPYKSDEFLKLAIKAGIYSIVIETQEELERIVSLIVPGCQRTGVMIRINPTFGISSSPLKMGGVPSQFGMSEEEALRLLDSPIIDGVSFMGLHYYNATRVLDEGALVENFRNIVLAAQSIATKSGKELLCLDIGGGWGIPYYNNETSLNSERLQKSLSEIVDLFRGLFPSTRLIVESGRYLVGASGVFLSRVQAVKNSYDKSFLLADGGINCFIASSGVLNPLPRNFPIDNISRFDDDRTQAYNVAGPLCYPRDIIAKDASLPKTEAGDILGIRMAGAYGPSAAPVNFLGHGAPAEVLFDSGSTQLLRRRTTAQDILSYYQL